MLTLSITMPCASRLAVAVTMALISNICIAAPAAYTDDTNKTVDAQSQEPKTLERVEVRATALDAIKLEQSKIPGGVSVLDGNDLRGKSIHNASDALRYVPGMWSESASGGDSGFLSSRGSNLDATSYDGNGIRLLQDGLPVTTADGNNHNRVMDPLTARSAIIARGANALIYGASTLGGAINFTSLTARTTTPLQFSLDAGDHGLRSGRLRAGIVSGNFDVIASLENKHWDGYRAHSQQRRSGLYANAGWALSNAFDLRLYATHIDNDEELPGALSMAQFISNPNQAASSAISGNLQRNVRTSRLAAKGSWQMAANRSLEFGLSFETQTLFHPIVDKIMVDFDGPGPLPETEVFSLLINTEQHNWGGMLRYHIALDAHDLLAGVNLASTHVSGHHYRNDRGRRNGITDNTDNHAASSEVFLVDRWHFAPSWMLVYGAQGVWTDRDVRTQHLHDGSIRNPKGSFSSINPRIGLIREFGADNQAFISLSRVYEAPTTFELENDARGDNTLLDAMHGNAIEVGLRGSNNASNTTPHWRWELSAYHARIGDEILSVDDPNAPGTSLSTNINRTTHAGIEALLAGIVPIGSGQHRIEPLISATLNHFYFNHDPVYASNRLPAAPHYALRGEVLYRHSSGFFIGPTFDLIGTRYADFSNSYRVDGYHLLGIRAGFQRGHWQLLADLRNLQDTHYIGTLSVRDHASIDDAILQSGTPRSLYLGLSYTF